jgi:hypothetical protein
MVYIVTTLLRIISITFMTRFSTKLAGVVMGAVLVVGGAAIAFPAHAASLTSSQVSAVVSLLQAFGADSATIARVQASLQGQTVQPPQVGCSTYAYLKRGDTDRSSGGMVTSLQRFLGMYLITGYYGPITEGQWNAKCGGIVAPTISGVDFSATPTSGVIPLTVNFRAMVGTYGGNYTINFGDGSTGSLQTFATAQVCQLNGNCVPGSASHLYTSAGTYTAMLTEYPSCPSTLSTNTSGSQCLIPSIIGTVTITVMPYQ